MTTKREEDYYIGLMSGTSIDGMDAALIAVNPLKGTQRCVETLFKTWPPEIKKLLHSLCQQGPDEIERLGTAERAFAAFAALTVTELCQKAGVDKLDVTAIGSHGQTVRHRPEKGFSLQLNNGPMTALLTGIDTWTDFRSMDIAAGGEGAPLTPLFHQQVFSSSDRARFVVNLGGIANMTVLMPGGEIFVGYDVGPANTLLDLTMRKLLNKPCDEYGRLASKGNINPEWLITMLDDEYLHADAPKSCGREHYGENFLKPYLEQCKTEQQISDLLMTLCALSGAAIAADIKSIMHHEHIKGTAEIVLCGGGVHNPVLTASIDAMCRKSEMGPYQLLTSDKLGVDPDFVEAQAFAYFAYINNTGRPANLRAVTGSEGFVTLGSLSPAPFGNHTKNCLLRRMQAEEQSEQESQPVAMA